MNKHILLFAILIFTAFKGYSSNEEISWETYTVGGGNLQKMNVINADTAYIAGYDRTFLRSADAGQSWEKLPLITSQTDFLDQSFVGDVGYIVGDKSAVVSGTYADGVLLKYSNGTITVLDISNLGEGDNPATNPHATGCGKLDFLTVEAVTESIVYLGVRWSDFNGENETNPTGIFKTEDGGNSWQHVLNCEGALMFTMKFSGDTGYVAGNKLLFRTTDGGESFTNLFSNVESTADDNFFVRGITAISGKEVYFSTISDGVLHTEDAGESMEKVGDLAGGYDFLKIDNQTFIVGGNVTSRTDNSKISLDGGISWENFNPGFSSYKVAGPWNDSIYFVGRGQIAIISVEDLRNKKSEGFKVKIISEGNNLNNIHIFNENSAVICANGTDIVSTDDAGKTWHSVTLPELPVTGANFDFTSLSTSSKGTGYLSARRLDYISFGNTRLADEYHPGVIFKTKNNWKSWEEYDVTKIGAQYTEADKNPFIEGCYAFEIYESAIVSEDVALVYVDWEDSITVSGSKTKHGRIYRTSDDGETWSIVYDNDLGSDFATSIGVQQDVCYVGGNNILLKSTNGGETFEDIMPNLRKEITRDPYIFDLSIDNEMHLFVTTSRDGIFETFDGGMSFVAINEVSGATDFVALNDKTFLTAGNSSKTQYTSDGGNSWLDAYPGSVSYKIGPVWNDNVYLLSKGVIYSTPLTSFGVDKNVSVNEPFANLENPIKVFDLGTSVQVQTQENVMDQLYVFNAQGIKVEMANPNANTYNIDRNKLNSGMYVVVVISGNNRYTQKIMIR